ncbi:MAG: TIGR00341 family protein [Candidatus Moraniibacteriota bacterium]|nr:MAG: TIGR00341 family protein [Candidatus Moranbacteria bacterium]
MSMLFDNITEQDKIVAVKELIDDSTPRPSFFFLVILSVLMAACGLIINNASVIIASMLIAPILSPVLSIALGIVIADGKLISRSFFTLLKSTGWAISLSAVTTWLLWNFATSDFHTSLTPEIIERIQPSIVYLIIAIIAGTATAFARVKPDLSETLPGTAIAVALVPPLATVGIGIATLRLEVASGAFAMFVLNLIGIVLAAMVMFSMMNLYTKKTIIAKTVEKADEELEKELESSQKKTETNNISPFAED